MADPQRWTIVLPFKPVAVGKSRLTESGVRGAALVRAIALDTASAALAASRVRNVIVVTSDADLAADLVALGARAVIETEATGIRAALDLGFADVPLSSARAALLGDLPALTPADLDAALELAEAHDRAFIPDAEGTGTTLVTARGGVAFTSAFGPRSAERHTATGLIRLDAPDGSSLRRDVDDPAQLEEAGAVGLGPHTRAVLSRPQA